MTISLVMAAMTALDPAAAAVARWTSGHQAPDPGELPEQVWGSAEGLSHTAQTVDTTANLGETGSGPGASHGQLPVEERSGTEQLGDTSQPPQAEPVEILEMEEPPEPAGFDEERSTEIVDEREAQARTFLNEDGSYTTRFYDEQVNFQIGDGSWQAIDPTLRRTTMTAPWTTTSTETGISFAPRADADPILRMRLDDQRSIGYAVEGAAGVVGEAEGPVLTYRGARNLTDLEFIGGNDFIKETLILHGPEAPLEWRFPLELRGLTAELDEDGAVVFLDSEGTSHAVMPPGWMQDSDFDERSGEGAISGEVHYELLRIDGRQVLAVTLDEAWLTDPERVYPVRVDPSVSRIDSSSSTYVQKPYNINFSTDTVLKAGTYDGGTHAAASFLRFSGVESTLKNAWVLDARLGIYNTWSYSCDPRPVTVHPITQNWSAATLKNYPGPATGAALGSKRFAHGWRPNGAVPYNCAPAWESIPLGAQGRALVDDWTHGRKTNYGLAVKASATDSYGWKQFGSSRYPNGAPTLDVTWTKYGATYRLGQLTQPVTAVSEGVQKVTVTNLGRDTWKKDGQYQLRYNLYDSAGKELTSASLRRYTLMPRDVAPGQSVTLDAKIAPLTPGTYTVEWTMTDLGVSRFTAQGVPGGRVRLAAVNIPPQLTAAAPGSGAVFDSLTPTLWADGQDQDRYPNAKLQYTFEVCEVDGENARKNCRKGTRGTPQQWAVPQGWLSWNKTYAWYAYVYDGKDTSLRPHPSFFSTRVPQPPVTGHLGGEDGHEFSRRSGNYSTAATDASLATTGPELAVVRTYNSLDPRTDTAFGPGWSTRWDMRATPENDGNLVITLTEGTRVRFGRNADGTFTGPTGGSGTLTAVSGGGWTLRDRSGSMYTFAADGRLTTVADGAGREQRLSHTDGRLTRVTDVQSGRTLSFTWEGTRVGSVTTNPVGPEESGLTWTYSYTGGQLAEVCPPTAGEDCTRYDYTDGSLYRSVVLDQSPLSYWRLGEAEGEIAESIAPSRAGFTHGEYYNVEYGESGSIDGTTDTSVSFNGTDSYVQLPHDTLRSSTFLTVEMWFRTTESGVLLGFQNGRLEDGAPDEKNPVLTVDSNGRLSGLFTVEGSTSISPLKSGQTVTDGSWHHAVLTAAGTTQALYLDGARVGSRNGPIDHRDLSYTYLGAGYSDSSWDGAAAGVRYFTGELDDVAVYQRSLDSTTIAEHYALRRPTPQLSTVTLPSGRTHAQVDYDPATGRINRLTDKNGGDWEITEPLYSNGSSSYADTIRSGNPTGYWRLSERTGAVAASALGEELNGSYLDGTRLGGAGPFTDGDTNSPYFAGGSAVEVPTDAWGDTSAQTIELWFRTSGSGVLVSMQDKPLGTTPDNWWPMLLVDEQGKLRGRLRYPGDSTTLLSNVRVDDDVWHHVILTGSEEGQALFLDGEYQASNRNGTDGERLPYTYIGGGYASGSWNGESAGDHNFHGQIAEVALYDIVKVTFTGGGNGIGYRGNIAEAYRARNALISGNGGAYLGSVLGDGPVAYWRLDQVNGTTLSDETGLRDATLHSNSPTTVNAPGIFGPGDDRALRLTQNSVVEIPGDILGGTSTISAELWFRTKEPGVLLSFQDKPIGQTPDSWRAAINIGAEGKLRGEWWVPGLGGAKPIVSSQSVTDNEWHHVVLAGAGNTQTLYLDGVKVGVLEGPIANQGMPYSYVGGGWGSSGWMGMPGNTYYFGGEIDEVALFRHALTEEQVTARYAAKTRAAGSALGATVTVTDPVGQSTSATYDALRGYRTTSAVDADGETTSYAYDTGGFLHTVTDPNGNATITGHDSRGNTLSTTTCRGPKNCQTSYAAYYHNDKDPLDPRNDRPVATSDARSAGPADTGYRTTVTYTAQGLPATTTLPDGRTTSHTYTAGTETAVDGGNVPKGLVADETDLAGARTTYAYYSNGDLAHITAPSGLRTEFTYDGLGRRLTETWLPEDRPEGITTTYTYDALSRVMEETGPQTRNEITEEVLTARTRRTFDADGRVLSETVSALEKATDERSTTYHYDARGLNDLITDAEGNSTRFGHDALGRVITETDPLGDTLRHTYTPRGQLATVVLEDWDGHPSGEVRDLTLESHAYDPAGRLARTTDAMGTTTSYTYLDDGLLATTTAEDVLQSDGSSHDIVLESNSYDRAGRIVRQVTAGGSAEITYAYDVTGRVTGTVFDPEGLNRRTTYTYDAADRVLEQRQKGADEEEHQFQSFTYDVAGNVLSETIGDADSSFTTRHSYDQRGLRITTVSPRGAVDGADADEFTTEFDYDALGRAVVVTAPGTDAGRARIRTGYNVFGEATESENPLRSVTRVEVDRLGRPTAAILPDYTPPGGGTITAKTETVYDALGQVVEQTDALGRTTRYSYDQLGNVSRRIDPPAGHVHDDGVPWAWQNDLSLDALERLDLPGETTFTWTPTGLQLSATGPTGATSEATYDGLGRQLTQTVVERHPALHYLTAVYTWDDAGRQVTSRSAGGRTIRAEYNSAGEVLSVTNRAGDTDTFRYDAFGRSTESIDATGRRSVSEYNALGLVVGTADYGTGEAILRSTSATYDAEGNQISVTGATGTTRTFRYDALGNMIEQSEPVDDDTVITTSFGYDLLGNRTRITDGRGNSTHYTYTSWGLPESVIEPGTEAHPEAADRTWTRAYDAAGQEIRQLLPGGVERRRTYDGLGRLVHESGSGAEATTSDRFLEYDLAGNMTAQWTDGALVKDTYAYNDRGQLLAADGPGGDSRFSYDADGQMIERIDGAGTTRFGYNHRGQLWWAGEHIAGSHINYAYDAAGRLTSAQHLEPKEGTGDGFAAMSEGVWNELATREYHYDALGRLTLDQLLKGRDGDEISAIAYAYDLDGLLTEKETRGTAGAGINAYTYDQAGRLISWEHDGTTVEYAWDASGNRVRAGELTAAFDERNRLLSDGTSSYTYTARGTLKGVTTDGGSARTLSFDAFERKITDGESRFAYDALDRVTHHGDTPFRYDGGSNNLVSDGKAAYRRTPAGNLLSMVEDESEQQLLTDRHDDVVAVLSPEGNTLTGSRAYDPFGEPIAEEGERTSVGYQSGWTDPESGEVNMAARWYQPGTGTFTSRDTWTLPPTPSGNINSYAYISGSPLSGTDPSGHAAVCATPVSAPICGTGAVATIPIRAALPILIPASLLGGGIYGGYQAYNKFKRWRSSDGSSGGNHSGGSLDSLNYANGLAASINAQASRFERLALSQYILGLARQLMSQYLNPAEGPGAVAVGGGIRGGSGGAGTKFAAAGGRRDGPPPPPQNPNRGDDPIPAPAQPPARINWEPAMGRWTSEQGWDMILDAQASLNLIGQNSLKPHLISAPLNNPGGKNNGRTRQDDRCDVGPGVSPTGHAVYLPRERYYDSFEKRQECRATGAYGLLDKSDYNKNRKITWTNTNASTQPPGMNEIRSQGHRPQNGHLIPAIMTGSGIDLRNLVAEYEKTNSPYLSTGVEKDIREWVLEGHVVHVSVVPHYKNDHSGIPEKIEYNYSQVGGSESRHCVIYQDPTGGKTTGNLECPKR
ncbi:DNRLRE domain-containing protein [Streptomyces sp. JH002]|uniref:LamG-like jellyroll fold domain-containing protein n=1 Tax=Streptomyces sp. JH002 TaxID=2763259 RepID=UPI003D802CE2